MKDSLGSVRLVIDATTGAVAQRLEYDEWGNITSGALADADDEDRSTFLKAAPVV